MELQQGLGLVELMIAMLLSILLSGALVQAYIGSRTTYQLQDSMSLVQEDGRFALNYLAKEIRMAGYVGCGRLGGNSWNVQIGYPAAPPSDLPATFDSTQIIRTVPSTDYAALGLDPLAGTDVLVVRKASSLGSHLNANMTSATSDILLSDANAAQLEVNDYAIIADCTDADIFKVSAVGAGAPVSISHTLSLRKAYTTDAEIMAFESTYYYIRDTERHTKNGLPIYSLYMKTRSAGSGGYSAPVELVEGVQNMKIRFGIDTTGFGEVGKYVKATDMTTSDWGNIVSVELNLLVAGTDDKAAASSGNFAQTIHFFGNDIPADGLFRQKFITTIATRNKLQLQ
jgi:type IV pilus assembly protein PilW